MKRKIISSGTLSSRDVVICRNLRLTHEGTTGLVPVGKPMVASAAGGVAIGMEADALFLMRGNGEVWKRDAAGERKIAVLEGEARCIMPSGNGKCILMADKPLEVDSEGCHDAFPVVGFPALSRIDMGIVSESLPPRKLRGVYDSHSNVLDAADIDTLTDDWLDAYCRLGDRAAASGGYVAPVIARVCLRRRDGSILHTSAPVIIGPEAGVQATGASLTLKGEGYAEASGTTLTATAFAIGISFPSAGETAWPGAVGSVEILVSPQLHPVDATVKVTACFGTFAGGTGHLSLTAPGVADKGDVAATGTPFHRRVTAALARLDLIMTPTVLSVSSGDTVIYNPAWSDTRRQLSRLVTVLGADIDRWDDAVMREISAPHSFTAAVAGHSGDMVVWGDITARRFDGYTAREFGVSHKTISPSVIPTACRVKFSDGSSVVSGLTERCFNTEALSPLITYPHPDAVELTVIAGTRSVTFPLSPLGDGRHAFWLDPKCRQVTPPVNSEIFVYPAAQPPVLRFADSIAVSHRDTPLKIKSVVRTGCGCVTALTPSVRTSSSWDFGRGRFYVFTTAGICAAALSEKNPSVSVIDSRGVTGHRSVVSTPAGVAAIAGGDLVLISGSRCKTLRAGVGNVMAGWCGNRGELWLVDAVGGETMVCDTKGNRLMTRDDVAAVDLYSAPSALYLLTGDGILLDASCETAVNPAVSVEWCVRVPLDIPARLTGMTVSLFSSGFNGHVTLLGDNGAGVNHALPIVDMDIDGEINTPVSARVIAPVRRYATLRIAGAATPDTIICNSTVDYEKYS